MNPGYLPPAIVIFFLLLILYWEIILCEGVHLGPKFVTWLYNLTAKRYDSIKQFDPKWERRLLGDAVANSLMELKDARILDVGAGTGRSARAVYPRPGFSSCYTCLEPARRMLSLGKALTADTPVKWVRGFANPLPFRNGMFDLVICLEVLEFTPDPSGTITELVRVLRPGSWLLITNRVSKDAVAILGKTYPRDRFPTFLKEHGLDQISTYPWQLDYDLVWAQKPFAEPEEPG